MRRATTGIDTATLWEWRCIVYQDHVFYASVANDEPEMCPWCGYGVTGLEPEKEAADA